MLTRREVEIVHGAAMGLSNDEIGEKLYLSGHTVKTHFYRVFRKTGMNDRAGLVAIAFKKGWLAWEDDTLVMNPPKFVKQGQTREQWLDGLAERFALDDETVRV